MSEEPTSSSSTATAPIFKSRKQLGNRRKRPEDDEPEKKVPVSPVKPPPVATPPSPPPPSSPVQRRGGEGHGQGDSDDDEKDVVDGEEEEDATEEKAGNGDAGRGNKESDDESAQDEDEGGMSRVTKKPRIPQKGPNVFHVEKKVRRWTNFETINDNEVSTTPSAADLATATIQQDTVDPQKRTRYGPLKAPNNVRVTMRVDYQPDICKDYYETGWCVFGDSCKFAHIREGYKSGWQLEKEFQAQQKERADKLQGLLEGRTSDDEKGDMEDDGLPHACLLCRENFVDPVVTKCGHYFCEKCAMDHFRITQRCAACDLPTNGIFNTAVEIIKRQKQRERKAKLAGEVEEENVELGKPAEAEENEEMKLGEEKNWRVPTASDYVVPSDFADSRKGKTSWL